MAVSNKQKLGLTAIAVAGLGLIGYAAFSHDIIAQMIALVDENTPAPLFFFLLIVLPVFGFPLSVFLVLLGIKYGPVIGIVLMLTVMPIHMIASFALAKIGGNFIQILLSRRNFTIPKIPADKQIRFTFAVASIPVAPYAIKNFLLALAGIPFRLYLGMNWACQGVLAMPAVVLGGSIADLDPLLFLAAIMGLVVIYLVVSRIEKKYGKHLELKVKNR